MSTNNKSLWELVKEDLKLKSAEVEVGYFETDTYPDGLHVAQVAYWNEYGTSHDERTQSMYFRDKRGRVVFSKKENATFEQDITIGSYDIPPRPFMRIASEEYGDEALNVAARAIADGKGLTGAMGLAASFLRDGIVSVINAFQTPPNKPSTIYKKGRSHPLIDTATMRDRATWRMKK